MSSTELVRSGHDLENDFLSSALSQIDAAGIEKRINNYYFKRAKKLYRRTWRKCRRKTGHSFIAKDSYYTDEKVCEHCGKPNGGSTSKRARKGISALASELRRADRAAGIEYVA